MPLVPGPLEPQKNVFVSLLAMATISIVLILISFRQILDFRATGKWDSFLFHAMLFYLVIVTFRTALLLILSFSERFFVSKNIQPLMVRPLVTVIIPCYNEEIVVLQAVHSAMQLQYPNLEILVIDDGSTDQTLLSAKSIQADGRIRVIHQANAGKAAALNRGILEAAGEYVLCVDADSILAPNILELGLPYFQMDSQLVAVAGSVQIGNNTNTLTQFQKLEYLVGLNFHKSAQSFLGMVTIVPGPIGLFHRQRIIDIGGYQTNTFAEDCDLTIRLLMAGYRIRYCAEMIAVTEAPEDYDSLLKQRYRWARGTAQAILSNSYWLTHPWKNFRNFCIIAYFTFETFTIPILNFLFVFFFIQNAISAGNASILGPYFIQLTVLDMVLTTYSVFTEKALVKLVFLSLINRLTYGLSLEVLRFFSLIDELVGLPMNWGKLQRKGLN